MSSPYTDAWPVAPIDLPHKRWQFDLFWGGVTLLFVLAVAGIVVTARTTGGQIAGGLGFGTGVVLCLWAWADVHYHPPQLVISPDIIIGGFKGHGDPPLRSRPGNSGVCGGGESDLIRVRRSCENRFR